MKNTIFIPKIIKVGYQSRSDTYTKRLAYIIYYDQKNVLRKENSWESWRDNKIDSLDFDNNPTSGFVLNKKAGGYSTGWNQRQTYVRIFDPRNFEFEITIPNLLYILENTNSIKGKGLEGEFVYGWDGTDLLLIPTSSPDYEEIVGFTAMVNQPESIRGKDLVLGGTYRTNKSEDWIYLGRFNKYEYSWDAKRDELKGMHYFFQNGTSYETLKSLSGRIIKTVFTEPVINYAELMEEVEHHTIYSPLDKSKDEYVRFSKEEFEKVADQYYTDKYIYYKNTYVSIRTSKTSDGKYYLRDDYYWSNNYNEKAIKIELGVNGYDKALSLNELYDKFEFMKKNEYLANGKLKH